MARQNVQSPHAPAPVGPYAQAIRAGDLLFISMTLPLDPLTATLVRSGVRAQTRRVLDNLKAILEAAGATLAHLVRVTLFVKNLDDMGQINEIYAEYFPQIQPTRTTIEVARLPKDAAIAVDGVAWLGA